MHLNESYLNESHLNESTNGANVSPRTKAVALITAVALLATIFTVAAPAQPAQAAGAFVRSSLVQQGNYFNPDGVLYGYLGDYAALPNDGDDSVKRVQSSYAQVSYHEAQIGQDVSIVHVFSGRWEANFDGTFDQRLATLQASVDQGKIPMYSFGTPDAGHVSRLLENDDEEVRRVQAWATTYANSGIGPMFARLAHEADRLDEGGNKERPWLRNPDLFKRWWRKFIDVVETDAPGYDAPTDLIWQWSPTAWGFWHGWEKGTGAVAPMESRAASLYPGDDYVDWIGSSGYDYPCEYQGGRRHAKDHEQVLEAAASWASQAAPTKPFMVAEWGSENVDDPGTKHETRDEFLKTTDDMLSSPLPGFDQIGAVVYFDRHHNETAIAGCNWLLHLEAERFPAPNSAYNVGANAQVNVTNAEDFATYRNLVNTPGLFVSPGPFEAPFGGGTCTTQPIADAVKISWSGFDGLDVNLRRDGSWIYESTAADAASSYVDESLAAGETHNYVARVRVAGTTVDTACGSVTMPSCAVSLVDGVPEVSWSDLNRTSHLRINGKWRMKISTNLDGGSYLDTEAPGGAMQSYAIRIFRSGVATDFACGAADVPAVPTCSVASDSGTVTVSWGDLGDPSYMNLRRDGSWLKDLDLAASSTTDTSVAPGATATYALRVRQGGESTDLDCGSVTLGECVVRPVAGGIEVAWTDQDDGSLNLRRNGSWFARPERGTTSYVDPAPVGTTNSYQLIVRNPSKRTLTCGSTTA